MPKDYKRMLASLKRAQAQGLTGDEAIMAAFEENARDLARVGGKSEAAEQTLCTWMGKPTGFIEYLRELPVDRTPVERVRDWKEFHHHMDEKRLRNQARALHGLRRAVLPHGQAHLAAWPRAARSTT